MLISTTTAYDHILGGGAGEPAVHLPLRLSDTFTRLEAGVERFELLRLAKRVGRRGGFTPRLLQLLEYFVILTRDLDWEAGGRPIVYQSLSRTALDLGVSERQIQKLEAGLLALGAIGFCDSPNHKRYGSRDPQSGRLRFAYGVDLTPLAYLKASLEAQLAAKQREQAEWLAAKRAIGAARRRIRWLLGAGEAAQRNVGPQAKAYARIAIQLRTHLSVAQLQTLLAQHAALELELRTVLGIAEGATLADNRKVAGDRRGKTSIGASSSEQTFVHSEITNPLPELTGSLVETGGQGSAGGPAAPPNRIEQAGLQHITLDMALSAASPELTALLPIAPDWNDFVAAADHRGRELVIDPASWGAGCRALGRTGAALCVVVTDRKRSHPMEPVRRPAAYFRGLVARGERGELRLERSLFGLLGPARLPKPSVIKLQGEERKPGDHAFVQEGALGEQHVR